MANLKEEMILKSKIEEFRFNKPIIIAGPCSVESEEQILKIAHEVKRRGANFLKGGQG